MFNRRSLGFLVVWAAARLDSTTALVSPTAFLQRSHEGDAIPISQDSVNSMTGESASPYRQSGDADWEEPAGGDWDLPGLLGPFAAGAREQETCSICLDPILADAATTTGSPQCPRACGRHDCGHDCGHHFHEECFDKWLTNDGPGRSNPTCPFCKGGHPLSEREQVIVDAARANGGPTSDVTGDSDDDARVWPHLMMRWEWDALYDARQEAARQEPPMVASEPIAIACMFPGCSQARSGSSDFCGVDHLDEWDALEADAQDAARQEPPMVASEPIAIACMFPGCSQARSGSSDFCGVDHLDEWDALEADAQEAARQEPPMVASEPI